MTHFIKNKLVDLSNFEHPGGDTFLEETKGTDISGLILFHHKNFNVLSNSAKSLGVEEEIKAIFNANNEYSILRKRVYDYLRKNFNIQDPSQEPIHYSIFRHGIFVLLIIFASVALYTNIPIYFMITGCLYAYKALLYHDAEHRRGPKRKWWEKTLIFDKQYNIDHFTHHNHVLDVTDKQEYDRDAGFFIKFSFMTEKTIHKMQKKIFFVWPIWIGFRRLFTSIPELLLLLCVSFLQKNLGWTVLNFLLLLSIYEAIVFVLTNWNHVSKELVELRNSTEFKDLRQPWVWEAIFSVDLNPTSVFYTNLCCGVNCQIEHHLFPTMHYSNLCKITPLVKSYMKSHNYVYYEHDSIFKAVASYYASLK